MSASYFHLSCDLKHSFFSGFSRLQEQEEFVDMTLAADGRLVKVHKNIMALASPYIKDILKTSPGDNQVIYLHNVSHNILVHLLEYIYQGETNIPYGSLETFMQLAQSLRIIGMSKPDTPMADRVNEDPGLRNIEKQLPQQPVNALGSDTSFHHMQRTNNVAASININENHDLKVQQFEQKTQIPDIAEITYEPTSNLLFATSSKTIQQNMNLENKIDKPLENTVNSMEVDNSSVPSLQTLANNVSSYPKIEIQPLSGSKEYQILSMIPENIYSNSVPTIQIQPLTTNPTGGTRLIDLNNENLDKESKDALKIITQYTVTERGSVEIIVSRYIYYSHHNSCTGRKHRWRCIDYRKTRCPAYIDSVDRTIVQRKGVHTHRYHDDKIYKKHEKGLIFSSYEQASKAMMLPIKPVPYDETEESADIVKASTLKIISVVKM